MLHCQGILWSISSLKPSRPIRVRPTCSPIDRLDRDVLQFGFVTLQTVVPTPWIKPGRYARPAFDWLALYAASYPRAVNVQWWYYIRKFIDHMRFAGNVSKKYRKYVKSQQTCHSNTPWLDTGLSQAGGAVQRQAAQYGEQSPSVWVIKTQNGIVTFNRTLFSWNYF